MQRNDIILAALSCVPDGFKPGAVQVQKLFYLLDREIGTDFGGPWFDHQPGGFGAFDAEVYRALESLHKEGQVFIERDAERCCYGVTPMGYRAGQVQLDNLPTGVRDYIGRCVSWTAQQSFESLVAAVNRHSPHMATQSIFGGRVEAA